MALFDRLSGGVTTESLAGLRQTANPLELTTLQITSDDELSTHLWAADDRQQQRQAAIAIAGFAQAVIEGLLVSGEASFRPGQVPRPTAGLVELWAQLRDNWVLQAKQLGLSRPPQLTTSLPLSEPMVDFDGRILAHAKALAGGAEAAHTKSQELLLAIGTELPWRYQSGLRQLQAEATALDSLTEETLTLSLSLTERDTRLGQCEKLGYQVIGEYFSLIQKLCLPRLIGVALQAPPLPFDAWSLTHPSMQRSQPASAIEAFWQADPDPAMTYGVQQEIDWALHRHVIRRTGEHQPELPWQSEYYARQNVSVGGTNIPEGVVFYYEITPGSPYRRTIKVKGARPKPVFAMPPDITPWFLTGTTARRRLEFEPTATLELMAWWEHIGTAGIEQLLEDQQQLENARQAGIIRRLSETTRETCPWQVVYKVRDIIRLLGQQLQPGDLVYLAAPGQLAVIEPAVSESPAPALPDDPWVFSHPAAQREFAEQTTAVEELAAWWSQLPHEAAARQRQAELNQLRAESTIRRASRQAACPWQAVYYTRQALDLAGQSLSEGVSFYFDPLSLGLVLVP